MPEPGPSFDAAGALKLREVRQFLRRSHGVPVAVFFAVAYALGSMIFGGMLSLFPLGGGTTVEILTGSGTGQGWWNYPGLLVIAPWGILSLPFFPTIAMVVVAIGVGLGMAVAVGLIIRLVRPSPEEVARSKAVGALTGLTPAMLSLVTLGSCCTTTAAATGGIGLIAQASGTSTANLLLNNWYLGVVQIAIVWVALFGQELLLTVYGGLLGLRSTDPRPIRYAAPPIDRRWVVGAALRGVLAVGGLLWSLAMLAEWTTQPPAGAGGGWWFGWIVQHQLLAGLAVGAAFFPAGAYRLVRGLRAGWGRLAGGLIAVGAVSLLVWLPPSLTAGGLDSLPGQVLGALGAPAAWGAISPGPLTGVALVLRWSVEIVAPAGFALAALIAPEQAFRPMLATLARSAPAGAPGAPPGVRTSSVTVPRPADAPRATMTEARVGASEAP